MPPPEPGRGARQRSRAARRTLRRARKDGVDPEGGERVGTPSVGRGLIAPMHTLISTDCTAYQNWQARGDLIRSVPARAQRSCRSIGCCYSVCIPRWQALLFVHSALTVGQPGKITRLVSGCHDESERLAARQSVLEPAASAYFVAELPPSLAAYKYANRPFALRDWLEHSGEQLSGHVAICDPDMVPLTQK